MMGNSAIVSFNTSACGTWGPMGTCKLAAIMTHVGIIDAFSVSREHGLGRDSVNHMRGGKGEQILGGKGQDENCSESVPLDRCDEPLSTLLGLMLGEENVSIVEIKDVAGIWS